MIKILWVVLVLGVGAGIVSIFTFAIVSVVAAIPTYFLWNWLMPVIFGITKVTFWQACGINFLAAILFKGSSTVEKMKKRKSNKE